MSGRRACWVECDEPGCEAQWPTDLFITSITEARTDAIGRGWEFRNARDYCPDHRSAVSHEQEQEDR